VTSTASLQMPVLRPIYGDSVSANLNDAAGTDKVRRTALRRLGNTKEETHDTPATVSRKTHSPKMFARTCDSNEKNATREHEVQNESHRGRDL